MPDLPPPEHQYPLGEFVEDFHASTQVPNLELAQLLLRRYSDAKIRQWRVARLLAAGRYLTAHVKELDRGSLGVFGSEQAMITGRVVTALWQHWARPEINPKTYNPPIDEFIHTCENLPGDEPPTDDVEKNNDGKPI